MPPPRNERVRIDPSFALECYLYYKPTVESSSHTCDTLTFFVFKTVPVFYPSPSNGKRPILDDAPFRVFGDYQETNTWPPQTRHDVKLDWTVLSRPYETGKILYRGATGEEPIPLAAMPVVIVREKCFSSAWAPFANAYSGSLTSSWTRSSAISSTKRSRLWEIKPLGSFTNASSTTSISHQQSHWTAVRSRNPAVVP